MNKDIKHLSLDELSKILGTTGNNIKRDPIYKDIIKVNKQNPQTTLFSYIPFISKRKKHDRLLIDYINDINYINILDLDIEEMDNWCDEDLLPFKEYTLYDFWHYLINLYESGYIEISLKTETIKEKNIDWGFDDDPSINVFLNKLPSEIDVKTKMIFDTSDMSDVYSFIGIEEDSPIENIYNYQDLIYQPGHLLNKLFNVKIEGVGKGEVLCAFLFSGRINGVSDNYDLLTNQGEKIEIKSPNKSSFRFGTKAGVGNYNFYKNIEYTCKMAKQLIEKHNNDIKNSVSDDLYTLLKMLSSDKEFRENSIAIFSRVNSAEISSSILELIDLFYHIAHTELHDSEFDLQKDFIYEDVFNKKYITNSDIYNVLKSIEYVENPEKFKIDIDEEIKSFFNNIDKILLFNEFDKEIYLYNSHKDISVQCISQGGLKVIGKNIFKDNNNIKETFEKWKKNKELNFYELYKNTLLKC